MNIHIEQMFEKIGSSQLLSSKIEASIEKAILEKRYVTGQKLPTESEFCELFSVSRTAVREALRRLSAKGLIDIRKGSGAYVTELSKEQALESLNLYLQMSNDKSIILQTIKCRQIIEPEIASLAAVSKTQQDITALEENIHKLKACKLEDISTESSIDSEFHLLLVQATQNPILLLLMKPVFTLMVTFKETIFAKSEEANLKGEKKILLNYHENIFRAIKLKNSRDAYNLMKEHLIHTEENYLKFNGINS